MPVVELNGGRIEYEVTGEGRPLVVLHSLLADRASFADLAHRLAPERRVFTFSLPGFDASTALDGGVEAIADRVAEAIAAMQFEVRPDLLGNGLGGFVAGSLASRHGSLVDRVILADTGAVFAPPGQEAFRVMARKVREAGMEAVAETAMLRLFPPAFIEAEPERVARARGAFVRTDPEHFQQACLALAELDQTRQLARISRPVLVLVGELDAATPPEMAEALVEIVPGARLKRLEGLGHAPQIQAPDVLAAEVSEFLAQGERATGQAGVNAAQ